MIISDPFETQNRAAFLTVEERSFLHDQLEHLKGCRGRACTIPRQGNAVHEPTGPVQRGFKRKYDAIGEFQSGYY